MKYHYNSRGLTLLELIVVLFIIGLAASIVAVNVGTTYESSILRSEARRAANVLRHGRDMALMDRMPVAFVSDAKANSYSLERMGMIVDGPFAIDKAVIIEAGAIEFFPSGGSTGGKIELRLKSTEAKTITTKKGFLITVDPVSGASSATRMGEGK